MLFHIIYELISFYSYEQLAKAYPDVNEYKIYHSQSLYKAGVYQEAQKVAQSVQDEQYTQRVSPLFFNHQIYHIWSNYLHNLYCKHICYYITKHILPLFLASPSLLC